MNRHAGRGAAVDRRRRRGGRSTWQEVRSSGPVLLTAWHARITSSLVTMHHIVADAWSLRRLVREASVLYGAFSRGLPSPLPELALQYADYAAWQQQWQGGSVLTKQLDYWTTLLRGVPVLELPTDRPRPPALSGKGSRERTLALARS